MFANIPKFIEIVVLMYLPDRILKSKGMLLMLFALERIHHERLLKKKYIIIIVIIIINRKVKILTRNPPKQNEKIWSYRQNGLFLCIVLGLCVCVGGGVTSVFCTGEK